MKCIYCNKEKEKELFNTEHVLPRMLGTFQENLTIKGHICKNCNSVIFSSLESRFKEDSEEGIFWQMYNLNDSYQVRIREEFTKMSFIAGLGDDFFNNIFPFFEYKDGEHCIKFVDQIKIKNYCKDGYLILLIDNLKKIRGSSRFKKLIQNLEGTKNENVSIFVGGQNDKDRSRLDEAISLLKELGIDYKEKQGKFTGLEGVKGKEFRISVDQNIGTYVARFLAKISFNYFSYCAIQSDMRHILFNDNFIPIKDYILDKKDLTTKEVVISIQQEPIIYDEKITGKRSVGHMVAFHGFNGEILSQISFLGKKIYTVKLGKIPEELDKDNFGCGHFFDPFNHKLSGMSKNPNKWNNGIQEGFGLFKLY
ncbi:MAG: HNH endonuclease [Candidatus Pacebacteria bacterium]|nr:HNH endonuclease [Candidatus Paceibacterota bacterium]